MQSFIQGRSGSTGLSHATSHQPPATGLGHATSRKKSFFRFGTLHGSDSSVSGGGGGGDGGGGGEGPFHAVTNLLAQQVRGG